MKVEDKVAKALANVMSHKEIEAVFKRLAFEEYQAIMENEDAAIEAESLETQEITLVTGCEVECTLETIVFKE
jgi:hypothetical protein